MATINPPPCCGQSIYFATKTDRGDRGDFEGESRKHLLSNQSQRMYNCSIPNHWTKRGIGIQDVYIAEICNQIDVDTCLALHGENN